MVDDRDIAWHDACFISNSIGIEHEGFVADPAKWYTEAMYKASAKLTRWLCDQYGIPKDRKHILGHGEAPDCSDHTDPGKGWNWTHYMDLIVNGQKVISGWNQKNTAVTGVVEMVKGRKYPAEITFTQRGGDASMRLYWSWAGQ